MIATHLPALQVVVPLVAAPVCVLLRWSRISWMVAMAASLFAVAGAWSLLQRVLSTGPASYFLGSWAAPWGIEYRVDETNAWVMLVVSVVSAVSLLFARRSVEKEIETDRIYLFYTAWLLCLAGLLGMAVTADAFNVFVFLEISSLSSYVLVSLGARREALVARPALPRARHRGGDVLPHRGGSPVPGDREPSTWPIWPRGFPVWVPLERCSPHSASWWSASR